MNIELPGTLEYITLVAVAGLAGAINALRSYASPGTRQPLIVAAVEWASAFFITVTSFLMLHFLSPAILGVNLHPFGSIGLSGIVAHLGLRQAILLARGITRDGDKP